MGRKIWSIIGLIISGIMLGPVKDAFADLHGHTTRAAIYLTIFILGMVISWTSVTSPVIEPSIVQQKKSKIIGNKFVNKSEKKSGLAIASLVLGIISFIPGIGPIAGILAIILGSISLSQINKGGLSGKGMAIAGITLGILGILSFLMIVYGYINAARSVA